MSSLTTRFPESKSCATGLLFVARLEDRVDQSTVLLALRSCRFPSSLSLSILEALRSGTYLLATHTIVGVGILSKLYHIPKYRKDGFLKLKNPSSKISPAETMVSPSLRV
ncbi:hypothetical protein L1987_75433 [Smallanthus sonchifolius]|uniref:Uncharacterized protein n=1 Tax=Smallanthus sonchifolius TaxID=185202 RepID=A0ACB9A5F1_9ASTR|nr:hypothetical protein L1987_75433 [Smallanthus sonchifolius]